MKEPRHRIARIIARQSLKQGVSKRLGREVAAYLLSERRVSELDSLLRDVQADWAEAGQVEVLAHSAHSLTAEVRKDIIAQIKRLYPQAEAVIVTEVLDPSVLAGVRLEMPHQQLDATAEAKLNKFKQLTLLGKA